MRISLLKWVFFGSEKVIRVGVVGGSLVCCRRVLLGGFIVVFRFRDFFTSFLGVFYFF